jgi:ribose 5-phosphate isomerase B
MKNRVNRRMEMIAIGSDHGGFALKEIVKTHLLEKGYEVYDVGCNSLDSCDYPVFGKLVGEEVASGRCEKGVAICTTGIGISIAANRISGVRAALCSEPLSAKMTRLHNDANVLAMGAGLTGKEMALEITDVFFETEFSNEERHIRRVEAIEN